MRIISTVPSITELLHDLNLEDEVVGITKFCVHPEKWFRNKPRIGGTKTLNIEGIKKLQPDLIIANKEENTKEQIELLSDNFKVLLTDIKTSDDALEMIRQIGIETNRIEQAKYLRTQLADIYDNISYQPKGIRCAYLIWNQPMMTVGNDTYIHHMINKMGMVNVFSDKTRYPETNLNQIIELDTDVLLLSSEPFPFKQKHINEFKTALDNTKCLLVNGEIFSWYGSRLLHVQSETKQMLDSIYS